MDLWGWFNSLPVPLQPQVVTAATQLSIFVLGFLTIFGTAFANRRNTLKAARDAQKLEIYNTALKKIEAAASAQVEADAYLRSAVSAVTIYAEMLQTGLPWSVPKQRFLEFSRLHFEQSERTSEVQTFLEQWAIIDPRLEVFRLAFRYQTSALEAAFKALSADLVRFLPMDDPNTGALAGYSAPQGRLITTTTQLANAYHRESTLLGAYHLDLNLELQELLLGHLFHGRVSRRDPPDPTQFAIRLDRHRQITRYFEQTEFFKNDARQDLELRQTYQPGKASWWSRRKGG